jgi:hypothetical protein
VAQVTNTSLTKDTLRFSMVGRRRRLPKVVEDKNANVPSPPLSTGHPSLHFDVRHRAVSGFHPQNIGNMCCDEFCRMVVGAPEREWQPSAYKHVRHLGCAK